jgi:hypothetical protein
VGGRGVLTEEMANALPLVSLESHVINLSRMDALRDKDERAHARLRMVLVSEVDA